MTTANEAQEANKALTNGNLYLVRNAQTQSLLMIAPLKTLQQVFNLHDAAVIRVAHEAGLTTECNLHFNGRTFLGASQIMVVLK